MYNTLQAINNADNVHGDYYRYGEYTGAQKVWDIYCPIHGRFEQRYCDHVNKKCGCPLCYYNIVGDNNRLTKDQFIKNLLNKNLKAKNWDLSKVEYKNNHTSIKIKCNICGHEWSPTPNEVDQGNGCPVCAVINRANMLRFSTEQYKSLLLERNIDSNNWDLSEVKYKADHTPVFIGCNKCNTWWWVRPNDSYNHGCPGCRTSKGEKEVRRILELKGLIYGIDFVIQKRFDDCRDKNPLPFDFYLIKYNICIEYNGEQHYKPVRNAFRLKLTEEEAKIRLEKTKYHDKIKTDYCTEIDGRPKLLCIPYWDFKIIEKLIKEFLNIQ